jgi:membrane protein YdbS with pleckstrin-like domain
LVGTAFIRRNNEDTEYTKNFKLTKPLKVMLLLFYKGDKVEMEAVIHNALLIISTITLSIISFYKIIPNIAFATIYISEFIGVRIVCLIYRFKKHDFKNSKDHYE